jgi:flagellar L-ring protein precursor FlgH
MKLLTMLPVLALSPLAVAQSLFTQPPAPIPLGTEDHTNGGATALYGVSMFAVAPPRPRAYKVHGLVTIVVDEQSKQSADQNLKTDKKYNINDTLNAVIDPWELLQLRLQPSNINNLKLIQASADHNFDAKGNYQRNDTFQTKIQAEIIDVKPNGVLVLEARKVVDKNGESQSTVLSGSCRQEDVTQSNTVFSSQLANLTLVTKNDGQLNDGSKKGLITRALETVFNF